MMTVGIHSDPACSSTGPTVTPPRVSATPSATPSSSTGTAQSTSIAREMIQSTGPR